MTNDPSVKTKVRRTRLKMLFDEFQKEIAFLEEKIEKCTTENSKLKSENEELRQQLDDSDVLSMKITGESIDGSKINSDISTVGDISTIIKLSNKLQEMIHVNENITRVNAALRKDLKCLSNERDVHLQDIITLRGNKFSHPPDTYNRYNVAALKTKVDDYEREIQQWKNAMKRADDYIVDLGNELEKYKRSSNVVNPTVVSEESQVKDFSFNGGSGTNLINLSANIKPLANSSATEFLQQLVSQVDSHIDTPVDDGNPEEICSDNNVLRNAGFELSGQNSRSNTPKQDDIITSEVSSKNESGEMFSDPMRFPACVKLLELTKARNNDESSLREMLDLNKTRSNDESALLQNAQNTSPDNTGRHFNNDNINMLYWTNSMAFANGGRATNGSVVHHHTATNVEDRSNKGDLEDDITIVLPSSDHSMIHQISQSPDNNQSREMLFHSPNSRNLDSGLRPRMDHELTSTENHLRNETKNGDGMVVVQTPTDYQYYPPNAYPMILHPPGKKIKVEDVYK